MFLAAPPQPKNVIVYDFFILGIPAPLSETPRFQLLREH